jgi:hypothetical protein
MITTHTLRIYGNPVANQSPRSRIATRADSSQFVHVYPATVVEDWQKCVNLQLLEHKARQNTPMLDGALRIEIWLFLTRQRSSSLIAQTGFRQPCKASYGLSGKDGDH